MKIGLVLPIGFRGMAQCSKGKGLAVIPRKRLQLARVPFLGSALSPSSCHAGGRPWESCCYLLMAIAHFSQCLPSSYHRVRLCANPGKHGDSGMELDSLHPHLQRNC